MNSSNVYSGNNAFHCSFKPAKSSGSCSKKPRFKEWRSNYLFHFVNSKKIINLKIRVVFFLCVCELILFMSMVTYCLRNYVTIRFDFSTFPKITIYIVVVVVYFLKNVIRSPMEWMFFSSSFEIIKNETKHLKTFEITPSFTPLQDTILVCNHT